MSITDSLINKTGQTVTHRYLDTVAINNYDDLDLPNCTFNEVDIKGIISRPRKNREMMVEGKVVLWDISVTVTYDQDVQPKRDGVSDEIKVGNDWFEVIAVTRIAHPFARGVKRNIAFLRLLGNR